MDLLGVAYTKLLWGNFLNENGGGVEGAQSDTLGFLWYGRKREIERCMPMCGFQFTVLIRVINAINWKNNSLNETSIVFGVTFVLIAN